MIRRKVSFIIFFFLVNLIQPMDICSLTHTQDKTKICFFISAINDDKQYQCSHFIDDIDYSKTTTQKLDKKLSALYTDILEKKSEVKDKEIVLSLLIPPCFSSVDATTVAAKVILDFVKNNPEAYTSIKLSVKEECDIFAWKMFLRNRNSL